MSVEVVEVRWGSSRFGQRKRAALMCNTSMKLLPLLFEDEEEAHWFLSYLREEKDTDPRSHTTSELVELRIEFRGE